MRAESLQRRPPRSLEAFIATRTVAGVAKKSFADPPCDDPRAPLSGVMVHVRSAATVLDGECFVAVVSSGRSPNGAISAGSSIATTAALSPGIPCCSSAPSDAPAEISFGIPSTNTPGFVAAAIAAVCPVVLCGRVAFSVGLSDLDWGSWEGSLPESSSLGGDGTPLRGAFISLHTGFKNSLRGKLYQLCGTGDILAAVKSWRPGPLWSAKAAHSFAAADSRSASDKGVTRQLMFAVARTTIKRSGHYGRVISIMRIAM
jgi:hypothetical protein